MCCQISRQVDVAAVRSVPTPCPPSNLGEPSLFSAFAAVANLMALTPPGPGRSLVMGSVAGLGRRAATCAAQGLSRRAWDGRTRTWRAGAVISDSPTPSSRLRLPLTCSGSSCECLCDSEHLCGGYGFGAIPFGVKHSSGTFTSGLLSRAPRLQSLTDRR